MTHLLITSFNTAEFNNEKIRTVKTRVYGRQLGRNNLPIKRTRKIFSKHAARNSLCSTNSIVLKLYPSMSGVHRSSWLMKIRIISNKGEKIKRLKPTDGTSKKRRKRN